MTAYQIETSIPIPPSKFERGAGRLGAIMQLEVGQSILFTDADQPAISATGCVATARSGRKFTTRSVEGGIRIWRIN